MGQHGSKSSIEARVIFQRVGAGGNNPYSPPAPVLRIQKRVPSQAACFHPSARTQGRSSTLSWPQSRFDSGGLVYVMDNPTGGVWVKPGEIRTRS